MSLVINCIFVKFCGAFLALGLQYIETNETPSGNSCLEFLSAIRDWGKPVLIQIMYLVTCNGNMMQTSIVMNTNTMQCSGMTGRIPWHAQLQNSRSVSTFSSPDSYFCIIKLARRQTSMNYNELQWFIFNFHCITSPSKETVNDFCPFYFLKEVCMRQLIHQKKPYLY